MPNPNHKLAPALAPNPPLVRTCLPAGRRGVCLFVSLRSLGSAATTSATDRRRIRPRCMADALGRAQTVASLPLPGRLTNKHTSGPYRSQEEDSGPVSQVIALNTATGDADPPQSAGGSVRNSALWTDPPRCLAERGSTKKRSQTKATALAELELREAFWGRSAAAGPGAEVGQSRE